VQSTVGVLMETDPHREGRLPRLFNEKLKMKKRFPVYIHTFPMSSESLIINPES
jgi:hypothetical protein